MLNDYVEKKSCECLSSSAISFVSFAYRYAILYMLTDAGPLGVETISVLQHGSMSCWGYRKCLTVPRIKWIGIFPSQIPELNLKKSPWDPSGRGRPTRKVAILRKNVYLPEAVQAEVDIMGSNEERVYINSLKEARLAKYVNDKIIGSDHKW